VDENGFLRNPQGFYLQAFRTDAEGNVIDPTGAIIDPVRTSTEDLQAVNVGDFTFTGEATENVIVAGNIDSDVIATNDDTQFFPTTIPYVNSLGGQEAIDAQIIPDASSGPPAADNQDAFVVLNFGPDLTGATQTVTFEIVFDANGTPASFSAPTATNVTTGTAPADNGNEGVLQVSFEDDNGNPQTIDFEFGSQGTTEGLVISDQSSSVIADSDGALAAPLAGVEVDEEGRVFAIFENGEQVQQYLVPLARFTNPDGLNPETGTIFTQSGDSGSFFLANPGDSGVGTIAPSALESSNADLGEELTDLIVTQRIYSANTSVIQTADQMLQELTQIR
jgi:flagellar hook protein FlgE